MASLAIETGVAWLPGLASMRRRAENNDGTLEITAPASGGTRLTWTARLRA